MRYLLLLLLILLVPAASALTITSISVSPSNPTTTATLSCLVTATGTGTLSANITWYRNAVNHGTDNQTISLTTGVENSTTVVGNIEAADTTKTDVWICEATIGNGTATNASNSTNVTIINSPPVLTVPIVTQIVNEDVIYNENAVATDADGDSITAFISSDLNASYYNGTELFDILSNGTITFTPTQSQIGNHTMAILAYDGTEFGGQNVVYSIIAFNDTPVFNPTLVDQTAVALTPFQYLVTGSDEEGHALNFSMQSNNTNLRITQISPTQANISFLSGAPDFVDRGYWHINVTVYENGTYLQNTTTTIFLNVTAPNRAPALQTIANQTGTQGALFELNVTAADNDTSDTLHFAITSNCTISNPWSITTTSNLSTSANGSISLTLNNNHVRCPYVNISVIDKENGVDKGGQASQIVFFNITNTNDAPESYNISYNASNTRSQTDMRILNTSIGESFVYVVNGTDPDTFTYAGDSLTYSDNTTLFNINSSTGTITFTPTVSDVGEHSIGVTVTDAAGLSANATINLTVIANYYPAITSLTTVTCQEDVLCTQNFTANDADASENLTFTTNSSLINVTQFTYNISGMSHTYSNSQVGNYSVMLTVSDIYGHTNTTNFTLVINNTNDAPIFDHTGDNVSDTLFMPTPVVANNPVSWVINASDIDSANVAQTLNFTANITTGNASLFTIEQLTNTRARIAFTPGTEHIGAYVANITVIDQDGANATQLVSFTVQNASAAPVIASVQPFNNGTVQTNTSLTATSLSETNVTFEENTSVTFNFTYTDADSGATNITTYYYRNGSLVATQNGSNTGYTINFDFFSAGTFDVVAVVRDNLLSNDTFTWHVTITNVNRPPVLQSSFSNRTINSTTTLTNEMNKFYDPDDDLDSNGAIGSGETNRLTFTMAATAYLSAEFDDATVILTPTASGTTTVHYNATDGVATVSSNDVTYTVFHNPESSSSSTTSSSSGGGGSSSSSSIPQPITRPTPYTIDIITPKPITIYENQTVIAPISLNNPGKVTLRGIELTARTDADVELSFLDATVDELPVGGSFNTSLAIRNYKMEGTFEVYVTATVDNPSFNDSAVFYINSLEAQDEGAAINTKITYARDLLTANPECGELLQLVDQAQRAYQLGNAETAEKLLSAVSEGCTYLKTQAAKEIENPTLLQTLAGYRYINVVLSVLLGILVVLGGLLVMHYARQQ